MLDHKRRVEIELSALHHVNQRKHERLVAAESVHCKAETMIEEFFRAQRRSLIWIFVAAGEVETTLRIWHEMKEGSREVEASAEIADRVASMSHVQPWVAASLEVRWLFSESAVVRLAVTRRTLFVFALSFGISILSFGSSFSFKKSS